MFAHHGSIDILFHVASSVKWDKVGISLHLELHSGFMQLLSDQFE